MLLDARYPTLHKLRDSTGQLLIPLHQAVNTPKHWWQDLSKQFSGYQQLHAENERLKQEALLLSQQVQRLSPLYEQNQRLHELLGSARQMNEKVLIAELIGTDPNPFSQRILINKGSRHGVFLGQPVLDARGLLGQVVELMPSTARVLLLSDNNHSTPVQVSRNGLRAIASGTGDPMRLELRHLASTSDIKEDDLLLSSGLGQRFPAGYPVARVKQVIHDPSQPFITVYAQPTAIFDRSRYLLLIFPPQQGEEADADTSLLPLQAAPDAPVQNNQPQQFGQPSHE